jgi:hypothetical protein
MREARISANLVAVLVLAAAPLLAQRRARPTGAHVVDGASFGVLLQAGSKLQHGGDDERRRF